MATAHRALIGISGAGKTMLALVLAARFDMLWCDTALLIDDKSGMTGGHIIEHQGIDVFRSIEEIVVCGVLKSSP